VDRPRVLANKQPVFLMHILVVDDEQMVLEAVKMSLEFYGYEVTACSTGKEAFELFKEGNFDAVVTDYKMPEMKGDELAAKIKEIRPTCPVIMVTAHAEMLNESILKHMAFVLPKPFEPQKLREVVAACLKRV
jgi:CheY-like chemotaxis protein